MRGGKQAGSYTTEPNEWLTNDHNILTANLTPSRCNGLASLSLSLARSSAPQTSLPCWCHPQTCQPMQYMIMVKYVDRWNNDDPTCWALPGLTALLATTILSMFDAALVTRGDTLKTIQFNEWKVKSRTLSQLKRAVRMRMMAGRVSQEAWPMSPLPREDSNSNSTWNMNLLLFPPF